MQLLNLPMMPSFDVITETLPDVPPKPSPPVQHAVNKAGSTDSQTSIPHPEVLQNPEQSGAMYQNTCTSSVSTQSGQLMRTETSLPQQPPKPEPLAHPETSPPQQSPKPEQPPSPQQTVLPQPQASLLPVTSQYMAPQVLAVPVLPSLYACMSYIPASLTPRSHDAREAARESLRVRRERFKQKKARSMHGATRSVRYVSRKVYADTRPRVNGRFIRKDSMHQVAC